MRWRTLCAIGLLSVPALRPARAQSACTSIPTFVMRAVAGNGTFGYSGDNGSGSIEFKNPAAVAVDASGTLYISDSNSDRIRKFSGNTVSTVAGNGVEGTRCDQADSPAFSGSATAAQLNLPAGLGLFGSSLYIADYGNSCVRKLDGGTLTRFAGNNLTAAGPSYGDHGLATDASVIPNGVAVDPNSGAVYISDFQGRIRKVDSSGIITTVAGGGTGDPKAGGPATDVLLDPAALAVDPTSGAVYISNIGPNIILRLDLSGAFPTITWVAGGGTSFAEGVPAKTAFLNAQVGVTVDSAGCVYIADTNSCRIRLLDAGGNITTVGGVPGPQTTQCADSGDDGPATSARLNGPYGVTADSSGNIYVADTRNNRIRKMERTSAPPPSTTCTYTATPPANNPESAIAGADNFTITAPNACAWSATSNATWINIVSNAIGTGSATVAFSFAANTGTSSRTGTLTVSGTGSTGASAAPATVTVTQAGTPCSPTISPTAATENGAAGIDHFGVTAPVGCAWTATTSDNWLALISGATGTASSSTFSNFSFTANPNSTPRTATINVKGSGATGAGPAALTVTQLGTPCAATITPALSVFVPAAATSGNLGVNFTATDCPWSAISTAAWITITSGATGTGNGSVGYSIAANPADTPRVGTLVVAAQIFIVYQSGGQAAAGCTATFSPAPPANAPANGGTGNFGVSFPQGSTCSWTAASNANWITVNSGLTGTGNGTVAYTLAANSTSTPRSGAIVAAGQPFTVNQAASSGATGCTASFNPAGPGSAPASGGGGSFQANFSGGSACGWTATTGASWLAVTSGLSGNGNSVIAYTVAPNTLAKARSAAITVAGQSFTVNQSAASSAGTCGSSSGCPVITQVQSAGSYGATPTLAPGTWAEIYGTNLSASTLQWTGSDFTGTNAPNSLAGVTVTFNDQPAYVDYVSPTQINVQVPSTLSPGTVQIVVNNNGQASAPYTVTLNQYQPGLLSPATWNIGGKQFLLAILPDGTYDLPAGSIPNAPSRPALPGETIVAYAIGFGPVLGPSATDVSAGQTAPAASALEAPVQFSFAGTPATITYAGLASGLVGLYQFDIVVPQVPAGSAVPLAVTLNGGPLAQTLYTAIGQ